MAVVIIPSVILPVGISQSDWSLCFWIFWSIFLRMALERETRAKALEVIGEQGFVSVLSILKRGELVVGHGIMIRKAQRPDGEGIELEVIVPDGSQGAMMTRTRTSGAYFG